MNISLKNGYNLSETSGLLNVLTWVVRQRVKGKLKSKFFSQNIQY